MLRHLTVKALAAIPLALGLSVTVFLMVHALEGDAVLAFLGDNPTKERVEVYRERFGLNDPLPVQYFHWISGAVRGNLGQSPITGAPIGATIARRLPATIELTTYAVLLSIIAGIPLGILAATHRNGWIDLGTSAGSLTGLAMPSFVMGILLIWVFAVRFEVFPPSGYVPFVDNPLESLRRMTLPAVTLSFGLMPPLMRQTRSSMLEVLSQDYMKTAQSKGLRGAYILRVHGLRNALIPVITVLGVIISRLLGGTVLVEVVFVIPGIGSLGAQAILERDLLTVQGVVLMMALAVTVVDVITDAAYALVDPRIRYG